MGGGGLWEGPNLSRRVGKSNATRQGPHAGADWSYQVGAMGGSLQT